MSKSADEGDGFQGISYDDDPDKNGNSNDGSMNNSEANSADTTPSKTSLQIAQNSSDEKRSAEVSSSQISSRSSATSTKKNKVSGIHESRKNEIHATTSKSDSHVLSTKDSQTSSRTAASRSHSKPSSASNKSHSASLTVTPPTPPQDLVSIRSSLSSTQSAAPAATPNQNYLLVPPRSRVFEESTYSIDTLADPKIEKPPHIESKTSTAGVAQSTSNTSTSHPSNPRSNPKSVKPSDKSTKHSTVAKKPTSSATSNKSTRKPTKSKSAPDSNSNKQNQKVKFAPDTKVADPQQKVEEKAPEEKKPQKPKNKNQELSILEGLARFMTGEKMPDEVESKAPIMETPKTPIREYHDSASQTSDSNLKSDESTIRALNSAIIRLNKVREKVESMEKPSQSTKQDDKPKSDKGSLTQSPKKDVNAANAAAPQKTPSTDLLTNEDLGPGFVSGSVSIDSTSAVLPLKNDPDEVKEWQNSEFGSIRKDSKEFPPNFKPTVDRSIDSESLIINTGSEPRKHEESLSSENQDENNDLRSVDLPNIDDLVRPHRQKGNDESKKTQKANGGRNGRKEEQCVPSCCNPNQFQAYQCSIVGNGDITESMLQQWVAEERSSCPKCELFEYILRQAGDEILDDAEIRRAFRQHMDYHVRQAVKEMKKIFGWAEKVSEMEPNEIPEPRQCQKFCDPYIKCRRNKEGDQVKEKFRGNENQSVNSEPSTESRTENVKLSSQVSPKESVMDKEFKKPKKYRDRENSILDNLSKYMTGETSTAPTNVPSKMPKQTTEDNDSSMASDTQLPNDDSTILAIKKVIQKLEARRPQPESNPENRRETRSPPREESSQSFDRNERRPRSSRSSQSKTKENSRDRCCWHGCYHYCRCHETCNSDFHYGRGNKADNRRYSNDDSKSKQGYSHQRNRGQNNDYNYSRIWGENGNQRKCCYCMDSKGSDAVTVVCRSKANGSPQRQRYCNNTRTCLDTCDRNHYCVEIQEPYWIQNDNNCDDDNCRQDGTCGNGANSFGHFYGCATATNGNSILNKYIDDAIRKFMV